MLANPVKQVISCNVVTCVLSFAGEVTCWGAGSNGQLGRGSTSNVYQLSSSSAIIFDQPTITVTQISGISGHACALFTNQRLRCWGQNDFGGLGQGHSRIFVGNTPSDMTSVAFVSFSDTSALVGQVSAGGAHT
jgi:hypothetical protein